MGVLSVRKPLGAILSLLAAVVAVLVGCFVILSAVAARKATLARQGWTRSFGSYEQILERYPSTEANASARELERLSARLGLVTATRSYPDRAAPTEEQAAEYRQVKKQLHEYLRRQIEKSSRDLAPPPESVVAYLNEHREDLDALHRHLIEAELPQWERQIEKIDRAPIPNLLGQMELQKTLLADVLASARLGDSRRARAGLEASWRLNLTTRDNPILIVQLIRVGAADLLAGALRQISDVPEHWRERLEENDFRESLLAAMRFEGWHWTRIDAATTLHDLPSIGRRLMAGVAKPYVRYCLSDVSDRYRRRVDNLEEVPAICDYDLSAWGADLNVDVPRWNVIGGMFVPYLDGTLRRLARLELDCELTVKLLEIEQARDAAGGSWPAALPGIEQSVACPREQWVYEASPDGRMTLRLDREIDWDGVKGPRLPTRFELTMVPASRQ